MSTQKKLHPYRQKYRNKINKLLIQNPIQIEKEALNETLEQARKKKIKPRKFTNPEFKDLYTKIINEKIYQKNPNKLRDMVRETLTGKGYDISPQKALKIENSIFDFSREEFCYRITTKFFHKPKVSIEEYKDIMYAQIDIKRNNYAGGHDNDKLLRALQRAIQNTKEMIQNKPKEITTDLPKDFNYSPEMFKSPSQLFANQWFTEIYKLKWKQIKANINYIDPRNNQKILLQKIKNNLINLDNIAYLDPVQLQPERYLGILQNNITKSLKSKNEIVSSGVFCSRCKKKSMGMVGAPVQIRGADEPMTVFYECSICGKRKRE